MTDPFGSTPAKLPLDLEGQAVVHKLARWLRISGALQLAVAGVFLVLLMMTVGCGLVLGGPGFGFVAMLVTVIPLVVVAAYLLQGLRTQAAGEQFNNLAGEGDLDYLELGFARLKVVFIIDLIIGVLMLLGQLLGVMG